jgi:hypothetical protein
MYFNCFSYYPVLSIENNAERRKEVTALFSQPLSSLSVILFVLLVVEGSWGSIYGAFFY